MKHSDNIANLSKSLAAFQKEVKNPKNSASNSQFNSKYAPLEEILSMVRPILGNNGLAVIQEASGELDHISVITLLSHESGEWIETEPFILKGEQSVKGGGKVVNIQGAGSMITYAKRYQLSAILGISSEDDDDGNRATEAYKNARESVIEDSFIDDLKIASLRDRMKAADVDEEKILEAYHLDTIEQMTVSIFMAAMKRLEATIAKKPKKQADELEGVI